ncbi:hypothetical protein [Streptomyces goshikiensis]|uniref:hypothetical protein n=1 Tax=Streptomyces goshikiensis TaxID=1942 RepID=UPI0036B3EF54
MGYTPPTKGLPFIAFEKKARAVQGPGGKTVKARPSVYVREHVDVKVLLYKEKTTKTAEGEFVTGRVTFDAASVGLTHDFGGSVEVGSQAAQLLNEAFRNQTPVTVALETYRRYAKDGEPISPLTPINELRGIAGDVTKAQAEITNSNCKVIIVGANGHFTNELVSDPDEWELLRENRHGDLAPDGWVSYQGAVIPDSATGPSDVGQQIEDALKKVLGTTANAPSAAPARSGRPALRAAHSAEAKPWESWNTDGRFNYGSYLATAVRETYAQAHRMTTDAGVDTAENLEAMASLLRLLLGMADKIQLGVYRDFNGTPVRTDRSHHEARAWIDYAVTHYPDLAYTADMADPDDAQAVALRTAWAHKVVTTAGPLMDAVAAVAVPKPDHIAPGGLPVIRPVTDELQSRYAALLALPEVGLTGWEQHAHPLLRERFGTDELGRIESASFTVALAEWEADPAAFTTAARAAKEATQPAEPAATAA